MSAQTDISFGRSIASAGMFLVLAALVIVGWQLVYWYENGHWIPISLRIAILYLGLSEPAFFAWPTLRLIWDTFAAGPLSLYLVILGSGITLFGEHKAERAQSRAREGRAERHWRHQ